MKRIFTAAILTAAVALAASAQTETELELIAQRDSLQNLVDQQQLTERYRSIWSTGRYFNIGYATTDYAAEGESPTKSSWSAFLSKGNTYYFPKRPLGGLVKIGIDARWSDVQVSKLAGFDASEWSSTIVPDSYYDDVSSSLNIGQYVLTYGMGIGVRAAVAPLSMMDNAARYLKASLYFHYRPSYTGYIISDNGETEFSSGFFNMFDFGGCIQYRFISLGIEGSWGSGKTKALLFDFDDEDDEDDYGEAVKVKHKIASTRFYISFAF
jgi:hypothetical protein